MGRPVIKIPVGQEAWSIRAYRKKATLRHYLAEFRAPLELASTVVASPFLAVGPRGDGHTALVLPGLWAGDGSTATLRLFLRWRGFDAQGWGLGRNPGFSGDLLDAMIERARRSFRSRGRPVSLIGWSLGGIYARETARRAPESVRCVVSLGSPIRYDHRSKPAPPVPSTAIFSVTDGVVAPHWARESTAHRAENIEVPGSHFGLGHNPLVLHVIADRLRQNPKDWRPFGGTGLAGVFYRTDQS